MRLPALSLLFPLSLCAAAQEAAPHRVEVTAPGANAQRRDASVARIVVGREDIARYGDGNLGEVLKRQPGVTLVGGELRMRGLGSGYTQVLIDGEPAPQGFSIESLSPELVERIELSRSASADQSMQAVAGSINIVLRKRAKDLRREDKAAVAYQHGAWSPSASTQLGGRRDLLAWSVNAALERAAAVDEVGTDSVVDAADGRPFAVRRADYRGRADTDRFSLAPRLNWEFADGDTLAWQTLAGAARTRSANTTVESALFGPTTLYPDNDAAFAARNRNLRSDLAWSHRVPGAGKLTVKALFDLSRRRSDYVFRGRRADGQPGLVRRVAAGIGERTVGVNGKYLLPLGAAHSLGLGWDAGRTSRDEFRNQRDAGVAAPALRLQDYTATVDRLALFAQDEWDVAANLQAYLGIRWEGLRTATVGRDMDEMQGSSRVASPVAQLLWKLPGRQQLRAALARTYKAPPTRDLVPRRYTINNDNSAVNPDAEGNPALRPELSWGLDLAYERYFRKDGVAALSAYLRRVSDVTAQQLYQDGANWVTRPVNDGRAEVAGIEFDLRSPLDVGGAKIDFRFNASRNWSRLERVPGPGNRLAGQIPLSANLGLDYRSAGSTGWALGANLAYQGSATSRTGSGVLDERGARALVDMYWTRPVGAGWRARVSAANALGRSQVSGSGYRGLEAGERRRAVAQGHPTVRLALERGL